MFEIKDSLNPSNEARTISPGRRLKNFWPTLELTIELVKNPDTLTTPERIPAATSSDIFVNFLTLNIYTIKGYTPSSLHNKYKPKGKDIGLVVYKYDNPKLRN